MTLAAHCLRFKCPRCGAMPSKPCTVEAQTTDHGATMSRPHYDRRKRMTSFNGAR